MSDDPGLTVAQALQVVIQGCEHACAMTRDGDKVPHENYEKALPIVKHLLQVIESGSATTILNAR